ncbi:LuxR C-terminal-related transcriptional regulator [Diaminobutyricimonas sp. TR449]|uniref:LuxR C-terminal-related transcriptional regulator n=1 Tax=Diaminobutyricimonas sp. TR449 TaxID=2708076 RepID=UPI001420945A|nr:LuxR C-terminal-related transcriptional regulator [Diaminobutyricimonas sp. TR449]
MAMPLLATKLFVPSPRPQTVPRPRLIQRMNEGLDRKLVLVSAPAGFGKSSALSAWAAELQRTDVRVAWLSLDAGDNDLLRFLTYLVTALGGAESGNGADSEVGADSLIGTAALGLLDASKPLPAEVTLTALINDVAQSAHEFVLVLDDFHLIDAQLVREAVEFLIEHLPARMHLAIASRADPTLPLARMRARGELTELRAADLRFTPDEAADFLNEIMGLKLSADEIAALDIRTEGWIAGLQLAALSMRGGSDIRGFIEAFTGSNRFIIDYLVEEVLQRQPERVRDFLLRTAILDRLSGPLCVAVTGQADAGGTLDGLERDNLFLIPLDDQRQWYRYHHLFADVLLARLQSEQPELISTLHVRASEWCEVHDLVDDAVRHALAAHDFERAARLIELAVPDIRRTRQEATLRGWLTALPEDVYRGNPVLSTYIAWMRLYSGDLDAVEPWLRHAELMLSAPVSTDEPSEELVLLPQTIEMYRAALAQAHGDIAGTVRHADRSLRLASPDDHLGRGAAGGLLALAAWAAGDAVASVRSFADASAHLRSAGYLADELSGTMLLADMLLACGRLHEARRRYERALQRAERGDVLPNPAGDLHVGLAELDLERNDVAAAVRHLEASAALGERAALPENRYRRFVALARLKQAEGDLDAAAELLRQAEPLYVRGYFPEVHPIPALAARVWVAQGRLADAADWARHSGVAVAGEPSFLRECEHLTLVRLLIAEHRAAEQRVSSTARGLADTHGLLDRLLTAAEASGRTGSTIEILMLQALAHQAEGRMSEALVSLERALTLAEPEGYLRLFADEGLPMAELLQDAARHSIASDYVSRLLAAVSEESSGAGQGTTVGGAGQAAASGVQSFGQPPAVQSLAEPLSERELHVLRLLRTELTGPEIARELVVSLNTVRTHTKNIFRKLDVTNRRAAVRRGEELGLV